MRDRRNKQWMFSLARLLAKRDKQVPIEDVLWYESTFLWSSISIGVGLVGAYLTVALKDIRWLLVAAWPFCTLVFVSIARMIHPKRRKHAWRIGLIVFGAIISGGGLWQVSRSFPPPANEDLGQQFRQLEEAVLGKPQKQESPKDGGQLGSKDQKQSASLDLSLALITTIHRMIDPATKGYMKGGGNDLVGVLRIEQSHGVSVRHLRSLKVAGDIGADFDLYQDCFSKGNGTESTPELEADYDKRKPFITLDWIIYPTKDVTVDQNDEKFAVFNISRSEGVIDLPAIGNGPSCKDGVQDAFGFGDTGQRPRYAFTVPTWSHLVRFTAVNPSDSTGEYPTLRDEVKSGKVKIQANIDGEIIDISPQNIRFPWPVSLSDTEPQELLPQQLFTGTDESGLSTGRPTPINQSQGRGSKPQ